MSGILRKKQEISRRPNKKLPSLLGGEPHSGGRINSRGRSRHQRRELCPRRGGRSKRVGFSYFSLALMAACAAATLAIGTRNGEQLTYESPAL